MNTVSTKTIVATTLSSAEDATLQAFGRAKLSDFFADFVIYRNLEPLDRRLSGFKASSHKMNLTSEFIPRKLDTEYANVALWFARKAQKLRQSKTALSEIIFIGDTRINDGESYKNMVALSGWQGVCFIGTENPEEEPAIQLEENSNIYSANRWAALGDWMRSVVESGFALDERTLVVVDIDKTALGAKGRNDQVINEARLEGIYRTMDAVLGENFDKAAFEKQYQELNRSRYHFLTEDNQDYLAYICLVMNAGLISFEEVLDEIERESLDNFEQFLRWVDSRLLIRPGGGGESFRQVHEAVICSVRNGDPTPFKRFRRQEFMTTIERMGNLPDDASVEEMLAQEITLTNEVCEIAEWLKERGALMLCLSDKPDEASRPDSHLTSDITPVHRAETHRVGTSIRDVLESLA